MSENRHYSELSGSTTSTSSALSSILMSNAGASYVLANNAIMFAPQLHSSSAGLPFSLVAPSGQVFLTAPVSLSPALPLPFLPSSGLAPQIPSFTTSSYPYGVLTTPTSSALSYRQHAPYNHPVGIISGPLESPTALNYPSSTHSVLEASPTTASTLSQPISLSLPFLKSNEARPLQDPMASSFNQTLLQTGSLAPSAISMQQKQSQDRSKEPTSSSTASLKKLLAVEPPPIHRDPIMEQIQGEPDLTLFYNCFRASGQSHHLHVEVLPSQDSGSLKWLQVRQKDFYIDPELGPVVVARILVSSNRIVKLQILFPTYKTVYTKLFVEEEMEDILSELSTDHVICPGLPGYKDKYTVLGYHPSHVRILETCHIQRYDHEHCPIWHVPSGTFSKRDRILQNMCKQCKYLQNGVVRLATKACEVDPAERESWTDPSSNRPLAYMSAADREERYRKLRQERNQMLVKLRTYEERLGIGSSMEGTSGGQSTESGGNSAIVQLLTTEQGEETVTEGEQQDSTTLSARSEHPELGDEGVIEEISNVTEGSFYRRKRRTLAGAGALPAKRPKSTST